MSDLADRLEAVADTLGTEGGLALIESKYLREAAERLREYERLGLDGMWERLRENVRDAEEIIENLYDAPVVLDAARRIAGKDEG